MAVIDRLIEESYPEFVKNPENVKGMSKSINKWADGLIILLSKHKVRKPARWFS